MRVASVWLEPHENMNNSQPLARLDIYSIPEDNSYLASLQEYGEPTLRARLVRWPKEEKGVVALLEVALVALRSLRSLNDPHNPYSLERKPEIPLGKEPTFDVSSGEPVLLRPNHSIN